MLDSIYHMTLNYFELMFFAEYNHDQFVLEGGKSDLTLKIKLILLVRGRKSV